jgi:hypothetical protein
MQPLKELPMVLRAQLLTVLILGFIGYATASPAQETRLQVNPDSRYPTGILIPQTTLPIMTAREPGSQLDVIYLPDGNGHFRPAIFNVTLL